MTIAIGPTLDGREHPIEETSKRYRIELFIIHPTLDPTQITAILGLDARYIHRVGDQRKTPDGRPLSGTYPDTRWRYGRRFETSDQWFAGKLAELINYLEPHKEFLTKVRATGGRSCIIVMLLGDGYLGDEIPQDLMKKMVELKLDFGIECFTVPQSDWS